MKAETEIEGAAETKEGKEENEQQSTQKHQEKNKHVQPNYLCCICCMSAPIDPNGLTIDWIYNLLVILTDNIWAITFLEYYLWILQYLNSWNDDTYAKNCKENFPCMNEI